MEDDLYTATLGLAASVGRWSFDLDEYLFTDKGSGLRFDETYVTVSRDFLETDSKWQLRVRAGGVHLGRGLYGERLQNFVHEVLKQDEVFLSYVPESKTDFFVRLDVRRNLVASKRVVFAALMEVESAGFKEHARIGLEAGRNLSAGFELHAGVGLRYTDTDYAPLVPWIEDSDPTFGAGFRYKEFLDLTWTTNYFGTGDNHWHVTFRSQFGDGTRRSN